MRLFIGFLGFCGAIFFAFWFFFWIACIKGIEAKRMKKILDKTFQYLTIVVSTSSILFAVWMKSAEGLLIGTIALLMSIIGTIAPLMSIRGRKRKGSR